MSFKQFFLENKYMSMTVTVRLSFGQNLFHLVMRLAYY